MNYKLFENKQLTLEDVIQYYYDCFVDLHDMGAYIGISDGKHLNEIDSVLNGDSQINKWSYYNSPIDKNDLEINADIFGIVAGRGFTWGAVERSRLIEMYNYMRDNLSDNEYQFQKMTNLKLKNKHITVSIKEWDVYPTDKRYDDIVKNNSLKGRQHLKVKFNKDENNRGYVEYNIYVNKGILYDNPSRSIKIKRRINKFLNWIGNKNKYHFPEITDKMDIKQFEISHEISDLNH